jgi:hypothetical protein
MRLPSPGSIAVTPLCWPRASRLQPARYQAADCFDRIQDPEGGSPVEVLARLAALSAACGEADLLDPARVLFGPGAGWINAAYLCPRPGRFSSGRQGAFYLAEGLETALAEVRHHLQRDYRREAVTEAMDLEYRALAVQVEGALHDIRDHRPNRRPWSAILDPDDHLPGQAFAAGLREAGSPGLAYRSVRHPGGACAAVFDPNTLRACRHDTYLVFRWNGERISQIYEKRILAMRS